MLNLLRGLAVLSLLAVVLFGSAGRLDLPFVWAYIGINAALTLVAAFTVDAGLQQERWSTLARLCSPATRGGDLLPWLLVGMPAYLSHLVVAGLDVGRFHWSDHLSPSVQVAGLVGAATAWAVVLWAMVVNRFFAGTIRIQTERGHRLVTAGPYQYVRHPGYACAIVGFLCNAPALGSWWALVPEVPLAFLIIRRTALEDRFLREELHGYTEYADRVRWRLLPGLW